MEKKDLSNVGKTRVSNIGKNMISMFKSIFSFLNTPRTVNTELAAGLATGVGFSMGKSAGKGIVAFLRSFFPYDVYDFFILAMILQHFLIDGLLFGYNYNSSLYLFHFWVALFFIVVFSIYRSQGEGFLSAFLKNLFLFIGVVLVVEAYIFPYIANSLRNPYFIINRIILPIWPIFAIAYASYKRQYTTPFVRKIVILFIVFLALLSWPYIQKIANSVYLPQTSTMEKIEAKITFSNIVTRLKENTRSLGKSLRDSVIDPIKSFINGSWIEKQIEPFKTDKGHYEDKQQSLELQITSAMAIPSYVTDEKDIDVKITTSFVGAMKNEIPKDIINNPTRYSVWIDKVKDVSHDIDLDAKCDEPAPLLNALTYQILGCKIPINEIDFSKNNIINLKAYVTYNFYTFAYRDFYFMDEKKLYEYIVANKNPYLEESGFLGGPTPTRNSGGPVLIGLSANGEMQQYPIKVSSKPEKHMFVISLRNVGNGHIKQIDKIFLLAPKDMKFSCNLKEANCYGLFGIDSEEIKKTYNCLLLDDKNFIKNRIVTKGNEWIFPCSFTVNPNILATYKNILPIYSMVNYQYVVESPYITVVKSSK